MSSIPTKQIDGDVAVGRNVSAGGDANIQGNARVGHDLVVEGWLEAKNIKGANKGFFTSIEKLKASYPIPHDGWWAIVGSSLPGPIYVGDGGKWVATGGTGGNPTLENGLYEEEMEQLQSDITDIQNVVSDIKTVSGGTIDLGNFDYSVLDAYNSQDKKGWYLLKDNLSKAGHVLVTGDDMGHVIHQMIFSDYVLSNGTIIGHDDGTPSVIVRTFNISSTTIASEIAAGTWSVWRYFQDTFMAQSLGDSTEQTVSQKVVNNAVNMLQTALNDKLNKEDADVLIALNNMEANPSDVYLHDLWVAQSVLSEYFTAVSNALAVVSANVTTANNDDCLLFDGTKEEIDYREEASAPAVTAVYYVRDLNKFVALGTAGDFYNNWAAYGAYREQTVYNRNGMPSVGEVFCTGDGTRYYYVNGGLEELHVSTPYTNNAKVNLAVRELYLDDDENRPYISRLFKNRYENGKYITQVTVSQLDGTVDCEFYAATDEPNYPDAFVGLSAKEGGKTGYAVIDWERVGGDFWANNDNGAAVINDIAILPNAQYFSPTVYATRLYEGLTANMELLNTRISSIEDRVFPLTIAVYGGGVFEKGTTKIVSIGWTLKAGDDTVQAERATINGIEVNAEMQPFVFSISESSTYTVAAIYEGKRVQGSTSAQFIAPMYFGFASAASVSDLDIKGLIKQAVKTSASGSYTLNNEVTGNFLWLCVPSVMRVDRVSCGGFDVPMEAAEEAQTDVDGYKCYRSASAINSGDMSSVIS